MPPDFLTPEHNKIQFLGKNDSVKKYKKLIVNNINKIILAGICLLNDQFAGP